MADPRPLETGAYGPPDVYDNQNIVVEDLHEQVAGIAVAIRNLENTIRAEKIRRPVVGVTQASTDDEGNVTFPVYQAPAGQNFYASRVVVEANGYTPAAPYANANFYLALYASQNPNQVAQGQLLDFTPATDGAQGLPNVSEYPADDGGPLIQGQHYMVCDVVAGPASTRVTVRYQGFVSAER